MLADSLSEIVAREEAAQEDDSCCHIGGHERGHHGHEHAKFNLALAMLGGILIVNSFLAQWIFYRDQPYAATTSAVIGAIILALPILRAAIMDVIRGKVYMNELVALALMAAFVLEKYQEAGIIAFFMLIAITIEEKTAIGAKTSIEALIRLTPSLARRINLENDQEEEIPALKLQVGDIIRVRPGENFPADGVLIKGSSAVNQASITGESLPVDKDPGNEIYAGTENLTNMVDVRVTGVGGDTTLGKVRDLIEAAEQTRLPIMRIVDRYVVYYTPTILMIAALVWFVSQNLMQVVCVLIISCPCALILATPSAVVAAIASAARLGVLIKDVSHLEIAAQTRAVVFDKTGTLTQGHLEVARLTPAENVELSELLTAAVIAESQSNHPVANAMRVLAEKAKVKWQAPDKFTEITGRGVIAHVGKNVYRVGREMWLKEEGLDVSSLAESFKSNEEFVGMSVVYVTLNKRILGWIGLRDAVREQAADAISRLQKLGISTCHMVTGDNESVAKVVARKVGIRDIQAECLPEEKAAYVEKLKKNGASVAVVGDGVNDAPALTAGDIGIAMGAIGSDVAVNSASVALMNNDLRRVPFLIGLSRKTRTIINMNLLFGAFLIVGGMMFFIFGDDLLNSVASKMHLGSASMIKALLAAAAHVFGTFVVIFNSARLVRFGEELQ